MDELGSIIGLDIGHVRIGVAVSDPLRIAAHAREVIQHSSTREAVERVRELVDNENAVCVVVGMPLDQNGHRGPQAEKVLQFIEELRPAVRVPVVTQDERYSTAAAERMLISGNVSRKGRKNVVDKVAAQHILQVYMDRERNLRERNTP